MKVHEERCRLLDRPIHSGDRTFDLISGKDIGLGLTLRSLFMRTMHGFNAYGILSYAVRFFVMTLSRLPKWWAFPKGLAPRFLPTSHRLDGSHIAPNVCRDVVIRGPKATLTTAILRNNEHC